MPRLATEDRISTLTGLGGAESVADVAVPAGQGDVRGVRAAGVDGIFTNEPLYAPRDYTYRTTRAPWPADGPHRL